MTGLVSRGEWRFLSHSFDDIISDVIMPTNPRRERNNTPVIDKVCKPVKS